LNDALHQTHYERAISEDPHSEDQIVAELVGSGASILELGCHSGYLSEYLASMGNTVFGLDSDSAAVERARSRGVAAEVRDLEEADVLRDQRGFDVILALNVLEHLHDPASLLDSALAAVAESGRLIVSVPNVAHYRIRARLLRGRFAYEDHGTMDRTHLRFFTRRTLRELLTEAGWAVAQERFSPGIVAGRLRPKLHNWLATNHPGIGSQHLIAEAVPAARR
jgi:2-polyprenyl-3-methyl-5-hydroxy-6-metoxy-1,4-benzoquinol methylase